MIPNMDCQRVGAVPKLEAGLLLNNIYIYMYTWVQYRLNVIVLQQEPSRILSLGSRFGGVGLRIGGIALIVLGLPL